MYEDAASACVPVELTACSLRLLVAYVERRRWGLQKIKKLKIITYGTNVVIVLTVAVGALFHHLCCVPCVCSGLQQEPAINSIESLW